MVERDKEWDLHFRILSSMARDSNFASDPASDPSLLNSVKKLHDLCKAENSEVLIARVYPELWLQFLHLELLTVFYYLAILQFFLDFGEVVLHDADPSLSTFFRSCLSGEFADAVVAEATLEFLNLNKRKLLTSFPTPLPQFSPLMLKLIAWNGEKMAIGPGD